MKATFIGASGSSDWSDAAAWAGGSVPHSNDHLDVHLDANATEDLGTQQHPFQVGDIIGASAGLGLPSLGVSGFLHASEISDLKSLFVDPNGSVSADALSKIDTVDLLSGGSMNVDRVSNVRQFSATELSTATIGSLDNVGSVISSFGATVEIRGHLGQTALSMAIGGNIIIDRPDSHAMWNQVSFALGNVRLELGDMSFDSARFLPSASGALKGEVELSSHGRVVYELENVTINTSSGAFSVGVDATTGHHYVQFA